MNIELLMGRCVEWTDFIHGKGVSSGMKTVTLTGTVVGCYMRDSHLVLLIAEQTAGKIVEKVPGELWVPSYKQQ